MMRRQRILRASSAQSLCVFCACRFGLEPGIARIPLRNISSTAARSFAQSAALTADNGAGSTSTTSSSSSFIFDPNSSLTSSEQQEKWRRMLAQRRVAEERQRIEAEKQQEKQQAIWEADEKRRKAKAAAPDAEKARLKEENDKRSAAGQAAAGRRKRSNGEQSISALTGQSLGQAMMSRKPLQHDDNTPRIRLHNISSRSTREGNDKQSTHGKNGQSGSGSRRMNFPLSSKEDGVPVRAAKTLVQNATRQPRETQVIQQKQPKRVAMPDFLIPQQSSGPSAPITTGWGARPTEVKPLEYGDVRSNVETLQSNIEDVPDVQQETYSKFPGPSHKVLSFSGGSEKPPSLEGDQGVRSDVETVQSNIADVPNVQQETFSKFPGPSHKVLSFSGGNERSPSLERDQGIGKDGGEQANVQEVSPSRASTLDTFGHYEDEATFEPPTQQDEPSVGRGPDLTHIPSYNSNVIAKAAVRAAALGGFGQSLAEEPFEASPAGSSSATTSQGPPMVTKSTSEHSVETSQESAVTPPAAQASSTPAAVPTDMNVGQQGEPSRKADVPAPVSAVLQPTSTPASSSIGMSPEQREMMEKIEQMRRMVEDFDRMNSSKTATPLPTRTQSYDQGAAPIPPPFSSQTSTPPAYQTAAQNRLGDSGYRATPFNPDEMFKASPEPAEDGQKWGHLRRQQDSKPTPPPAQPPPSPMQSQPTRRTSKVVEEDADKLFEVHRATRTSYAPPVSAQNESYSFIRRSSDQDLSHRKCARCGQIGHTAMTCQGRPRHMGVCHNCGKEGHMNRDCPEPRAHIPTFKIFVGGVSQDTTPADFTQFFAGREGVTGTRLLTHFPEEPGMPTRNKGFGFVSFESNQARERFLATGPFTLHGKSLDIKLDQGAARRQTRPNDADGRVANPFDPAEASGGVNIVRRTLSDIGSTPPGSDNPPSPHQSERPIRYSDFGGNKPGETPRVFDQAENSSPQVEVEDPKRSAREARRRQWEEPEAEVEKSDKGTERKGRRGNRREIEEDEEDERGGAREAHRARKAARQKQKDAEKEAEKQAAKRKREMKKKEAGTPITLPEFISVQHLSQALGVRYEAFVERLEELGYDDVFAGKTLDSETSGMIAMEYNFDPTFDGGYREEEVRDLKARPPLLDRESLPTRPPVVTIMGHVDHGKTTLLDYLRKSSVAAGEAGGITQHIGAFSVPLAASGKTVTFLDTPGHAAFLAMRQRGANVTDMVILVVAADDSVKPQTLEAIKHAKEAGVPMIVALNKVDKPEADVERCKQDLARHGVEIEDYGGEVQVVEVSGKTGKGMDALEENIVALSELLDHRAETDGAVEGWVLEATTRKAGRVATVLIRRGTLVPGAVIVAGRTWARVRTLKNEAGVEIEKGGPGMPCEVDGWRDQPSAGDEVLEAPTEQKAGSVVEYRNELAEREQTKRDMEIINANRKLEQEKREKEKAAEQAAKRAAAATAAVGPDGAPIPASVAETVAPAVEPEAEKESGQLTVPFIIKADVSGSAEAVAAYILSLSSPLIAPTILASGVGSVHESDIELASAAEGHIIAFNLPNDPEAMGKATSRGVKILANDIIYRCLDDVKAVLEDKLPPIISSRVTGEADISATFEIGVGGRKKISIAGVKVRNGSVTRNARVRVMRDGEKVYDGTINSLKNQKKDADVMRKGSECGMGFDDWEGFQAGDQVQVYEEISEKRRL